MGISNYNSTPALNTTVPGSPAIQIGKLLGGGPTGHHVLRQAIQQIMADIKTDLDGADGTQATIDAASAKAAAVAADRLGILDSADSDALKTITLTVLEAFISQNVTKQIYTLGPELTISSGVITATHSRHLVDTEADAASDNLDTINGGTDGMILIIQPADDARTVSVQDGTGNINLPSNRNLAESGDILVLMYAGNVSEWREISFANA